MRVMRVGGGVLFLAVVSGGCGTAPGAHARWHTGWDKPGMTGASFEGDVRECDRAANRVAAAQPGHQSATAPGPRGSGPSALAPLRQAEHEKAYVACMTAKGYTETK